MSNGNENKPIMVTRETRITNRDIADLLVTAFEGGVNYWMDEAEPLGDFDFKKAPWYDDESFWDQPGAKFKLHDLDQDKWHVIDKPRIAVGFSLFASQHKEHFEDFANENYDAITADVWFQLCVFGEIVYG